MKRILNRIKRTGKLLLGHFVDTQSPEVLANEEVRLQKAGGKKILFIATKYDYGDKSRGLSYEHYHFYSTLADDDYSLIYFAYDELKEKYGVKKMSEILRQAIYYHQPDILLYFHFVDWVDYKIWKEVANELPTKAIIMFADDFVRYEDTRPIWELFNGVVTMDKFVHEKRKKEGFSNSFLSQWGVNHHIYKDLGMERIYDVVFIGQAYGKRPGMIKQLEDKGISVHKFGRGWPGSKRVSQADLIKIYNQSKIIFNSFITAKGTTALNARDFEGAACGSLMVSEEIDDVKELFVSGKEIVTYKNMDEAAEKIKYYLEHDAERKEIAKAGQRRVLNDHTYERRFREIFAFAEKIA